MVDTNAQALSQIFFTIFGEPASKANSRRLVTRGGKPMFIKSQKALDYAGAFKRQAPETVPMECDVKVTMTIYYASRRPDLDESLVLDLLQGVAYLNDRQVKEKHICWALDKDLPRCEIMVTPWSGLTL
jgi:Holliday junction resolvase RusA-like endonuclease